MELNVHMVIMMKNARVVEKFDKELKKRFLNTYKYSSHDNNKFILLSRKVVYRYEYMDDWEKFNETALPEKEDFYSQLNMKHITDADYAHPRLKKNRRILSFVFSRFYIIVSWCMSEFYKYVS